jgi:glucan phosphoethanolaminetransferase (alkaline phosphatase superfamily)
MAFLVWCVMQILKKLKNQTKWLVIPVGLLLVIQGLLTGLWSNPGVHAIAIGSLISIPGLTLVMLALSGISGLLSRAAAVLLLFLANYVQFTFQSYFGRFIGVDELKLAAANPAHELIASATLYFSITALMASLVMTAVYWYVMSKSRTRSVQTRSSILAVLTLISWCALITTPPANQGAYSAVVSFVATGLHTGESLIQSTRSRHATREEAPTPQFDRPRFDVIYVIGESLRADRFDSHAYRRDLSANLKALGRPHVSFSDVASDGDCTNRSLPLLMVEPDQPLSADIYHAPTLFAYAKSAGFQTAFITANDNDWREFIDNHIDVLHRNLPRSEDGGQFTFSSDNKMLPVIAGVANHPGRQFIVVESYAAHWPYSDRYETCSSCRRYLPDLVGKPATFSASAQQKIENSYDNAVIYFDRFVDSLIASLTKPTLIVLTSDHGESLGEMGKWGHCSSGLQQMLVPLIFIATDEVVATEAGFQAIAKRQDYPVSHANIFPTFLKMFGFEMNLIKRSYKPDLYSLTQEQGTKRRVLVSSLDDTQIPQEFRYIQNNHLLESHDAELAK